ncbi:Leucine-rich repeat, cysteine-containing subtype [Sesbania bispinosa]|nr:Leucine-rich repeat, cysteine-containing subtype [Sesbania bispinosa]
MGLSPSTALPLPDFKTSDSNSNTDADFTLHLPDDCLAGIFYFLSSVDRKRCSLVCRRWFRVDGQSRHRLSLNAHPEILDFVPSLFTRFESVTKLTLRCDRRSSSINDDALILISLRCQNLSRLKLRGCRDITEVGMASVGDNCKALKKLSCASCMFGTKGIVAVIDRCVVLEELSVKRLRGVYDNIEVIGDAASSLKSICLKELFDGQSFLPLIIGSKNLRTLKLIGCLGNWDEALEMIGCLNNGLIEIHLEKIQVSDVGLRGVSNCLGLDILHVVKTSECSNMELVLIGIYPTSLSLEAIASNCKSLERLALCGIGTLGDAEIECIAAKCVALKKLCIKGCPVSNAGIGALASGCPNLVKVKVKKCRKITGKGVEWLREQRGSLAFNYDDNGVEGLDVSGSDGVGGAQDSRMQFPIPSTVDQINVADDTSSSNNNGLTTFTTRFGFLAGRNLVPRVFKRWLNSGNISSCSFS